MKKMIILVITVVLVAGSAFGCATDPYRNNKTLSVYASDISDNADFIIAEADFQFCTVSESPDAPGEMTISIDGHDVKGTYSGTSKRKYNTYLEYEYMSDEGLFMTETDGKLSFFIFPRKAASEVQALSDSECIEKAKQFASSLRNISAYTIINVSDDPYSKYTAVCFSQEVAGFTATDSFSVTLNYDGDIIGYASTMTERVPDDLTLPDDTEKMIDENAMQKLKSIEKEGCTYRYEIKNTLLTILENNQTAVVRQYDVSIGDSSVCEQMIELVIVL
ncbi:MAG: hypothetical protein ILO53_00830 [Clostridia bacterium]|nr:hypothetical protein [Clostridia bacterium]